MRRNFLSAFQKSTSRSFSHWLACAITASIFFNSPVQADEIDDFINAKMAKAHIAGLSLAVVQDGKIVKAQGYGFADKEAKIPVTASTLFEAGSISKSVAAAGILHLVQEGKLSLDTDINTQLRTWKVPENEFTKNEKVTLRRILSHSAGLTVHGFSGYATNATVPTLVQVLDGVKPPANSPPIRVDTVPGAKWRYSGGGYLVAQQLVIDLTGRAFPEFMRDTVLTPFGMTNSTYEQPLPLAMRDQAATGYYSNGEPLREHWRIYPEMAAAGLWTTASDLARFTMGIQQAVAGTTNPVLSQATVKLMLTDQIDGDGLGVFLDGHGQALRFSHDGRDLGFDSFMLAYAESGKSVVILMNQNNESTLARGIINLVAKQYGWDRGLSVIPATWKFDEFFNIVTRGHVSARMAGMLALLFLVFCITVWIRRLLRRYSLKPKL